MRKNIIKLKRVESQSEKPQTNRGDLNKLNETNDSTCSENSVDEDYDINGDDFEFQRLKKMKCITRFKRY